MSDRHAMLIYTNGANETATQFVGLYLEGLGNVSLTYEKRFGHGADEGPHLVVSVDFPVGMIDVIDSGGCDRKVDHR
jgi:hypothetical protein